MPAAGAHLAGAGALAGSVPGISALAWGGTEAAFRLRLLARSGARAGWAAAARAKLREWTFLVIAGLLAAAVLAAFAAAGVRAGAIGARPVAGLAGEAMIVAGAALRVWAMITLDCLFTFAVGIQSGHRVVRHGPYRAIRHPGYAGALVALAGIGVALGSWLSVLVLLAVPLLAFVIRIRVEEAALTAALGQEYADYARDTAALVPRFRSARKAQPARRRAEPGRPQRPRQR